MSTYIVIDLEMCGVQFRHTNYRGRHEIVQIGAVMMNESFEVLGKFSTFVRPDYGKIDYFISSLTGISDKDVRHAPNLTEALQSMLLWIGKRDICFYAWSNSDYSQLKREIVEKHLDEDAFAVILDPDNWVDYQKAVDLRFELHRDLSLADALVLTELEVEGQLHDGLADAWNTARIISKLEQNPDYEFALDRLRKEEQKSEPLTMSLGSLLQGIVLETA